MGERQQQQQQQQPPQRSQQGEDNDEEDSSSSPHYEIIGGLEGVIACDILQIGRNEGWQHNRERKNKNRRPCCCIVMRRVACTYPIPVGKKNIPTYPRPSRI